jgi:hypothetical protein
MGGFAHLEWDVVAEWLRVIKVPYILRGFLAKRALRIILKTSIVFSNAQQTLYKLPIIRDAVEEQKWTQLLLRDGFRTPWPV